MKKWVVLFYVFSASHAFAGTATNKLKCESVASQAVAAYLERPQHEFDSEFSVNWACKLKADPKQEEIIYGDGSGIVGVSLKIENKKCVVKDVYTGQDDQDEADEAWDAVNCLHNVR